MLACGFLTHSLYLLSTVHAGAGSASSDVEPGPDSSVKDLPLADVPEAAVPAELLHGITGSSKNVRAPAATPCPAATYQRRQEGQVSQHEDAGLLLGAFIPSGGWVGGNLRQDKEARRGLS